ncbi:hypothetical protein [Pseudomonas sp. BN411]|uniref:hypothetical protein n=1 Tax=Pseudomonas sp. BN411 TaxID=2567887 RepID=UPI002456E558|nr:hypothetical protein [Pseudomonas sp. BN411]MDH4562155.1 hypothetical protein [Pseudomonas sp. BN411]
MSLFNITYFFRVSKTTANIESVVYIPTIEAVETASTMFVPADSYTIHAWQKLQGNGPVNINEIVPGTIQPKTKR